MAFYRMWHRLYDQRQYEAWNYVCNMHHERYKRNVEGRKPRLTCQECHGVGGEEETIDIELGGPWVECGFCEGTGLLTPHMRGVWLGIKRAEKKQA